MQTCYLTTNHAALSKQAQALASQYGLPFQANGNNDQAYILQLEPDGLKLYAPKAYRFKPLHIDFSSKALSYRQQASQKELLRKLIRIKALDTIHLLDATAGLGQDACMFQHLGCHVTMLERSPILAALLDDALQRVELGSLQLIHTAAQSYLSQLSPADYPDIVYLDPMYPHQKKSALVKKEMRMLRELVGSDDDATTLLPLAQQVARYKVIVKRPLTAKPLNDESPSWCYKGKAVRFDVYSSR